MQNTEYNAVIERLDQLEEGLSEIKNMIDKLTESVEYNAKRSFKTGQEVMAFFGSNKRENAKIIEKVLEEIGITGQPIPAEELQRRMAKNGIRAEDNEFSRAIIQEREN